MFVRETLFGQLSLADWPPMGSDGETDPWRAFVEVRRALGRSDTRGATEILSGILGSTGLPSRHYLQAWSALRSLGSLPSPAQAGRVEGVVVEVAMSGGVDTVAAYADHTSRYFNYSGAAVIWDTPDASLNEHADRVINAGAALIGRVGVVQTPPSEPAPGHAQVSVLSAEGLRFGRAGLNVMVADALVGPVLAASKELMLALIAKSRRSA